MPNQPHAALPVPEDRLGRGADLPPLLLQLRGGRLGSGRGSVSGSPDRRGEVLGGCTGTIGRCTANAWAFHCYIA